MGQHKSISACTALAGATRIAQTGRLQPARGLARLWAVLGLMLSAAAYANGNHKALGLPSQAVAVAPSATGSAPPLPGTTPPFKASPTNGLTIEALANAQRQKLAAQLEASTPPTGTQPEAMTPSAAKKPQRQRNSDPLEGLPTQSLVVMATYGTPAHPKAEVQWNGATRVLGPRAALGTATLEAISHGQVTIQVVQRQKPMKYTLQPGDRLEWRP